eukprot:GFKZ01002430.1.p1 GENE.GFKZ01002430.1~~GFKZ01002430.1.p1  ORF type:complete len:593 (+),score=101.11 GFKZ01002430.1:29-1807(+)
MPPLTRSRIATHKRLQLALYHTPTLWLPTLPHPTPTLSLIQHFPLSPPFQARLATYTPNSSSIITYPATLHLIHSALLIRSPNLLALLPISRLASIRPGVLTISNVLLHPDPSHFPSVSAALSRLTSIPPAPPIHRFRLCAQINADQIAKTYHVIDCLTGEALVLKLYRRPPPSQMPHLLSRVIPLRAVLQKARGHPFILDLRHAMLIQDALVMIVEPCHTDLFTLLRTEGPLEEHQAIGVVAQLASALERVHQVGGWVGVLRPQDILIDHNGWIRLAGVAGCRVENSILSEARELSKSKYWSKTGDGGGAECDKGARGGDEEGEEQMRSAVAQDIWGLGMLAHFMLTGDFPFAEEEEERADGTGGGDGIGEVAARLGISRDIQGEEACDFLACLLNRDVEQRMGCGGVGVAAVREHAWLRGVNWRQLERRQGPCAVRLSKIRDVELLDLGEMDVRQTFSVPVLPEGLVVKDRRRAKFAKLFAREAKEEKGGGGSEEGFGSSEDKAEGRSEVDESVNEGKGIDHRDDMFVFGFGFSSSGPAFSTTVPLANDVKAERRGEREDKGGRKTERFGRRRREKKGLDDGRLGTAEAA